MGHDTVASSFSAFRKPFIDHIKGDSHPVYSVPGRPRKKAGIVPFHRRLKGSEIINCVKDILNTCHPAFPPLFKK
jgi:hypothetical protein